ncbi:MAG: hypothetical protein BWY08_01397 [Bacteroidetes bacterium ADurb.Bin174]|nr:MAG: hypothetical protein BWY08_01397 [Bacteroidetes bacterium ADurb.Bin174]
MQTILIELRNNKAFEELHSLEEKDFIRIVSEDFSSYSLPGKPINEDEFRAWVEHAENTPTVSLNEAKQQWETRKKKLQNLIK